MCLVTGTTKPSLLKDNQGLLEKPTSPDTNPTTSNPQPSPSNSWEKRKQLNTSTTTTVRSCLAVQWLTAAQIERVFSIFSK